LEHQSASDYQINSNNTLVRRYDTKTQNLTPGLALLAADAYLQDFYDSTDGASDGNGSPQQNDCQQTRFQFNHQTTGDTANNTIPTVSVQKRSPAADRRLGCEQAESFGNHASRRY
jgi:hypothetical protein